MQSLWGLSQHLGRKPLWRRPGELPRVASPNSCFCCGPRLQLSMRWDPHHSGPGSTHQASLPPGPGPFSLLPPRKHPALTASVSSQVAA